ncbi:CPBP family intramembrane glutamic endopeptidase [Nocardia sp. CC227C]|uniref:CPBP family intramembrane glutamic endopeptidase n=1 Tax=Nocardia sp. CC227C TaxID=3044562 RepID=UPI00278C1544|nr:CPBP family intramembrane glutamic endopeptidase [Nocardia sp. CC227C]
MNPYQRHIRSVSAGRTNLPGMENTQRPAAATERMKSNRWVNRLLADQHPLPLSVALHLVPGVLIVATYLLCTAPLVESIDGPPFLGWMLAMCLALAPVELGLLLWLGRRRNGRYSLDGVVGYLGKPLPRMRLTLIVAALITWFVVLGFALMPVSDFFQEWLFRWVPFESAGGGVTKLLDGYPDTVVLITLASSIPLTGLSFPIIEELYFRGFLLPRISRMGRWAPLVNTTLFSLYHFWSPWALLTRVVFILPGVWLVWRKHDLRLSIGMHAGTTLLVATFATLAMLLNFG